MSFMLILQCLLILLNVIFSQDADICEDIDRKDNNTRGSFTVDYTGPSVSSTLLKATSESYP